MKKRNIVLMLAALCMFSGCGGIDKVEESTVTADEKGMITQVLIEDFSSESYEEEELESSIQELVEEYNQQAGSENVSVESFEVKKDVAKVKLTYGSDEDYRGFNQVDFFAGTVEEALQEGYAFAGDFMDAKSSDADAQMMLEACKAQKVLIIREPMQVLVSGKILYVSKNMEVVSEDKARMVMEDELSYDTVTTEAFGYVIYEEN